MQNFYLFRFITSDLFAQNFPTERSYIFYFVALTSCPYRTIIQMRWYLLIRKILFMPDTRGVFAQNAPRKRRYNFYDEATHGLSLQDNNTHAKLLFFLDL